jgi:hypothetical protein
LNRTVQGPSYQTAGEHGPLVDETKFIPEGIRAIKTAFTPGLCFDRTEDRAVGSCAHALVTCIEIVYREVHMVRIRLGVPGVAISPRIDARKNGAATPEVMSPGRDSLSGLLQDGRVEGCGVLNV